MDDDQNQAFDLGSALSRIGNIPTQKTPELETITPQPLWPKALTPNISGEHPASEPVSNGYVARPASAPIADPLKDPQMYGALPYLVGAGVGRGAGALISKLYPDVAALGAKALDWAAAPGVGYQLYDMVDKLRAPLIQAWNNGVMPSVEREQAMYEDLRRQTQKNFEQHPDETVAEVKSFLQWQPDTPGGKINRSEYLKGVPYSVLSRAYADLYPMPPDNAPHQTTVAKTASWEPKTIASGSSPAGLD